MSEAIEDIKALSELHKAERQVKAEVNIEQLTKLNIPAREQSKNVFRVDTKEGAVMYYPTSGKWQHKGKVFWGQVGDFKNWLKKQKML